MSSMAAWVSFSVGVWSIVLTGMIRHFAVRRNWLDIPNARSSHSLPTPRGGGLAIVLSFSAALALLGLYRLLDHSVVFAMLASGAIVAVVGYVDDRHSLPARVRFTAQIIAASLFVMLLGGIPESALGDFGLNYPRIAAVIVVLTLTWSTNLFNFMDGIDGIAGGEAAFVAGAGAWLNSIKHGNFGLTAAMLCLCAASIGFLFWNWSPARIFLGDVGSGFLGLMLPMLGLAASQRAAIPVQVWIILGGSFFADATLTLVRRAALGDRWFEAHRSHAYQQLARRWNSHSAVTVLVMAINLIWLLPWAWYAEKVPAQATMSAIEALSPLVLLAWIAGAGKRRPAD
jgi:Fuc2NAc and GlcNAc transferase